MRRLYRRSIARLQRPHLMVMVRTSEEITAHSELVPI